MNTSIEFQPVSQEQKDFDEKYITSSEICQYLGVTRPAIHFRRKAGELPGAINVFGQQLLIWERAQIQPHLDKWMTTLTARRAAA